MWKGSGEHEAGCVGSRTFTAKCSQVFVAESGAPQPLVESVLSISSSPQSRVLSRRLQNTSIQQYISYNEHRAVIKRHFLQSTAANTTNRDQ